MPWLLYAVPKTLREETLQVIDSTRAKRPDPLFQKPDDYRICIRFCWDRPAQHCMGLRQNAFAFRGNLSQH
jgi:hypothetical protein